MIQEKTYEAVSCVICGNSRTETITHRGQFGWATHVSICPECGLVFLNPRWTKAGYDYFYTYEYDQFYREDPEYAESKEIRKAKMVWQRLQKHTAGQFRDALDIGCGLGWVLQTIAADNPGMKIAGIEPSEVCIKHFTEKLGGELIARDVDENWAEINQKRFDLIILRHVIEHLMDPVGALTKVASALSDDGVLYIGTPDMQHPDGPLHDFWFRSVHTYYFSAPTLERVAALAGLEPVTLVEENSELWGIFRRAKNPIKQTWPAVYPGQIAALNTYKRKRRVRDVVRAFSPQKISRFIPKSLKNIVPEDFKRKFRNLIYRH